MNGMENQCGLTLVIKDNFLIRKYMRVYQKNINRTANAIAEVIMREYPRELMIGCI